MANQFRHLPPATLPPIVGRDRERAALREALAAALTGRGSLVLTGGEAGIGKTTLAEATLAEASGRGALALTGRCYDLAETPPYGPWIEVFARAPSSADLPTPPDLGGTGVASQAALFAALRDYLAALAATRPVVLLLEDLHWADSATLDLLRFLARGLGELPLLLLATYRADELTRRHPLYQLLPTLVREAQALRVALRPLDRAALPALVRTRYALPSPDEARLVAYLAARGEGNPFYVGELLRSLEEVGTLRHDAATWSLGDLAGQRVPALLRQVLDSRLDRLGEEARERLAVGAVLGQELSVAHWAAVAGVPEGDLLGTIEGATEARLLVESADGERVRFAHALVREALYEGLTPTRRRALHRRIAEALAATPAPDPDTVADHFRRAGDARAAAWLERAAERARRAYAWRTAADRLEAALAIREQCGNDPGTRGWLLLRLALFLRHADRPRASALLKEAAALAERAGDPLLRAHARFSDGLVRSLMLDYRAGIGEMEAAIGALDALAPLDMGTRARLRGWGLADDPDHQRGTLVFWYAFTGRLDEAVALGEAVAARAATTDAAWLDGAFAPDALRGLGFAYALRGRPDEARAALERNLAAYRAAGDFGQAAGTAGWLLRLVLLPYRTEDLAGRRRAVAEAEREWARTGGIGASLRVPIFVAPLPLLEGRWEESRAIAAAAAELRRPEQNGWAQKAQAIVPLALAQGDRAAAWAALREALPDGPATAPGGLQITEFAPLIPITAALALDENNLAEARAWLDCLDRLVAAAGAVLWRSEGALGWAAYYRAAGDPLAARQHAERALARASEPRQPLALLVAHRMLGELDTAGGRHGEAQAHFDQSLALAEVCAAPYERALTILAQDELHAATGNIDSATDAVAVARAILEPLEAAPALARADALAARLVSPAATRAPAALPLGLTAREVEVLALVAEGLTDPQIAARLFVSRHTVGGHVKAIYGKLGVNSRASATRLALDHGIR